MKVVSGEGMDPSQMSAIHQVGFLKFRSLGVHNAVPLVQRRSSFLENVRKYFWHFNKMLYKYVSINISHISIILNLIKLWAEAYWMYFFKWIKNICLQYKFI